MGPYNGARCAARPLPGVWPMQCARLAIRRAVRRSTLWARKYHLSGCFKHDTIDAQRYMIYHMSLFSSIDFQSWVSSPFVEGHALPDSSSPLQPSPYSQRVTPEGPHLQPPWFASFREGLFSSSCLTLPPPQKQNASFEN